MALHLSTKQSRTGTLQTDLHVTECLATVIYTIAQAHGWSVDKYNPRQLTSTLWNTSRNFYSHSKIPPAIILPVTYNYSRSRTVSSLMLTFSAMVATKNLSPLSWQHYGVIMQSKFNGLRENEIHPNLCVI